MDQNFPLMKDLIPLLFVRKTITNRALIKSEKTGKYFRKKCNVGDRMSFWDNYRQKGMKRIGIGYVLETKDWEIDQIPFDINRAKSKESPKKDIDWYEFAWLDGFDYYNKNQICLKTGTNEIELESQLRKEFKEKIGKYAIWRGKETKNYIIWKNLRIPNFVDFFHNHKKKVKEFRMFHFKGAKIENKKIIDFMEGI